VAELLRKEPGVQVELIDGNRGEFTVSLDGHVIAQKQGESLPDPEKVVAAVKKAQPVKTG
jgi:hypothetical protein